MKNAESSLSARPTGVELLILRILRGGFASTLVSGAMGAAGCESGLGDPVSVRTQDPSRAVTSDGSVAAGGAGTARDAQPPPGAGTALDGGSRPPSRDAQGPSTADARASDPAIVSDASTPLASSCTPEMPDMMRAAGLSTVDAFDYVAIRRAGGIFDPQRDAGTEVTWTSDQFTTVTETGRSCATASDGACAKQVAQHPAQFAKPSCAQTCYEYSVVTTRGDEVKRWATDAELLTLLGKVDTEDEALFFALRAGFGGKPCASLQADGLRVVATHMKNDCPIVWERATVRVSDTGKVEQVSAVELPNEPGSGACTGRVPAGLCSVSAACRESVVGDFLAHCAHLEDASVYAFERLARELAAYGAPRDMIAASLQAADDEVRHARVIGELARARGGEVVAAEVSELSLRTLEEIATENATEGCVRETYGALIGGYQARCALDLGVRAAMREVAADEARHAALSHRVHRWALSLLDAPARERVLAAQRRAIAALRRACEPEVDERLCGPLGLPSAPVAQALLHELGRALWAYDETSAESTVAVAVDSFRRAG